MEHSAELVDFFFNFYMKCRQRRLSYVTLTDFYYVTLDFLKIQNEYLLDLLRWMNVRGNDDFYTNFKT